MIEKIENSGNKTPGYRRIRLGTRKSRLAMAQTELAAKALCIAEPGLTVEIVPLTTKGDRILDRPLLGVGGKGAFITEFEDAIQKGEIDAAVHSAKDIPTELGEGLCIASVLQREDPRDVLITVKDRPLSDKSRVIGTGSLRRRVQIMEQKNVECRLLRGNIDTRLEKLYSGEYDGIILAAAGLKRLGLTKDERFTFDYLAENSFTPACGQGIIVIEAKENSPFSSLLEKINDPAAAICLRAEREVLRLMGAGCNEAIGVYSVLKGDELTLTLMLEENGQAARHSLSGPLASFIELARKITEDFRNGC